MLHNLQTKADSKQESEGLGVLNHSHYLKANMLSVGFFVFVFLNDKELSNSVETSV